MVEIYAQKDAYQSRLQTAHFHQYKTTTLKTVKYLKFAEMDATDSCSLKFVSQRAILQLNADIISIYCKPVLP